MKYYADLTNEEAREWLIRKDKTDPCFWADEEHDDLAECVYDNIRDFGTDDEVSILKLVSIDDTLATVESKNLKPTLITLTDGGCLVKGRQFLYQNRDDLEQKLIDILILEPLDALVKTTSLRRKS